MDLSNKVALITGGKRIGAVVARELAGRGVDIAFSYARSKSEAEQAAGQVRSAGRRAEIFQTNLADPGACAALVESAVEALGRLDILIDVDLRAAFLCAHAAAPHMRRQGGGRIVNFSDWIAKSGRPRYVGYVPYYVAKTAVIALTEALALELASDNILVNAIAPGPILAPPGTTGDELKAVEDATPLGRWGGEIEIAKGVIALLDSDFITGETIRIDGGRHIK